MLVVEHSAVELEARIGAERKIGTVRHHEPRRAVGAGAHGLVAQHAVADADLARRGGVDDFVMDDGGFADARRRLRMREVPRRRRQHKAKKQKLRYATSFY